MDINTYISTKMKACFILMATQGLGYPVVKGEEGITMQDISCCSVLFENHLYLKDVQPNALYFKIWVVGAFIIPFHMILFVLFFFIYTFFSI